MFFFLNCVLFCFTVAAPATQTKSSGKPEINQQEFTQLQQQLQDMKEQVICNFLLRLSANHIDEYNFDQARDLTHVTFPALGTGCESIFWSAALVSRFWFKPLKFAQMLVFFRICMLSILPSIQMLETFLVCPELPTSFAQNMDNERSRKEIDCVLFVSHISGKSTHVNSNRCLFFNLFIYLIIFLLRRCVLFAWTERKTLYSYAVTAHVNCVETECKNVQCVERLWKEEFFCFDSKRF